MWSQNVELTSKRFKRNSIFRYFQTSTKNFSVQKLKVLAPFMGHLGYSGCTVNASYCHSVILNSFLAIFMIFLRLQSFEIVSCTDILLFLIYYFKFKTYICTVSFFNLHNIINFMYSAQSLVALG